MLRSTDGCGKGSERRPAQIMPAEEDLRWALAQGRLTRVQFNRAYRKLLRAGMIRRGGRVLHG